jgi:protein-S-isoprenylcysteine O-methyltransferase Ste14
MKASKASRYRRLSAKAGLLCSLCTVVLIPSIAVVGMLASFRPPKWLSAIIGLLVLGALLAAMICVVCAVVAATSPESTQDHRVAEPGAAPNDGPATPVADPGVTEGPPSVS